MKSWIYGGIIGIVFYVLLITLSILFEPENFFGLALAYIAIPTYFFIFISSAWFLLIPLQIIYFFIIGAIIGLIVGKIKSKKN